eukprot:s477_g12.t1
MPWHLVRSHALAADGLDLPRRLAMRGAAARHAEGQGLGVLRLSHHWGPFGVEVCLCVDFAIGSAVGLGFGQSFLPKSESPQLATAASMVQLERYRLDQAEAKTLELKRHKAAVAAMVRPTSEAAKVGGSTPWPRAQTRAPADRRLFRETFEAFRSKDAMGLSAEGFTRLCQQCFLLTKTFGLQEAQQLFWEVTLPGTKMDLNCFEAALSLIAWRTRRSSEDLRRAVILAGSQPGCGRDLRSVDLGEETIGP